MILGSTQSAAIGMQLARSFQGGREKHTDINASSALKGLAPIDRKALVFGMADKEQTPLQKALTRLQMAVGKHSISMQTQVPAKRMAIIRAAFNLANTVQENGN